MAEDIFFAVAAQQREDSFAANLAQHASEIAEALTEREKMEPLQQSLVNEGIFLLYLDLLPADKNVNFPQEGQEKLFSRVREAGWEHIRIYALKASSPQEVETNGTYTNNWGGGTVKTTEDYEKLDKKWQKENAKPAEAKPEPKSGEAPAITVEPIKPAGEGMAVIKIHADRKGVLLVNLFFSDVLENLKQQFKVQSDELTLLFLGIQSVRRAASSAEGRQQLQNVFGQGFPLVEQNEERGLVQYGEIIYMEDASITRTVPQANFATIGRAFSGDKSVDNVRQHLNPQQQSAWSMAKANIPEALGEIEKQALSKLPEYEQQILQNMQQLHAYVSEEIKYVETLAKNIEKAIEEAQRGIQEAGNRTFVQKEELETLHTELKKFLKHEEREFKESEATANTIKDLLQEEEKTIAKESKELELAEGADTEQIEGYLKQRNVALGKIDGFLELYFDAHANFFTKIFKKDKWEEFFKNKLDTIKTLSEDEKPKNPGEALRELVEQLEGLLASIYGRGENKDFLADLRGLNSSLQQYINYTRQLSQYLK